MKLYRVIIPVREIERAALWYALVLGQDGTRVSPGRHYFDCGETILACFDAIGEDGLDPTEWRPNPQYVYISTEELDAVHARVPGAGPIEIQPWGERCFYARDPFGNPLCFVDAGTEFTG